MDGWVDGWMDGWMCGFRDDVQLTLMRSVVACYPHAGLIPNLLYRGSNVSIMITNEIYESAGDIHKGAAAACAGVGREEQQDDTFGPSPGHSCQAPPPPQGKCPDGPCPR